MNNEPKKYRKKPVVVEAMHFDSPEDSKAIAAWILETREDDGSIQFDGPAFLIDTLEGRMTAKLGDYIIRGTRGEFYPCKPDAFHDTFEEATQ